MRRFVQMHEYGHLLRGHLKCGVSTPTLEDEADEFARVAITAPYRGVSNTIPWVRAGALGVLVLLRTMEAAKQLPQSHTHPPALRRIERFLEDGAVSTAQERTMVSAMLGITAKTLEDVFNVQPRVSRHLPA